MILSAQGALLQAFSRTRYIAHSFAPALAFAGAEMAKRAGVPWAGDVGVESARILIPMQFSPEEKK